MAVGELHDNFNKNKNKNVPALALAKNSVIEPIQYGENIVATLKINLMASVYDAQQRNREARTVCALWLVSG